MEASSESFGLFAHDGEHQSTRAVWFLCPQILNIYLSSFITKLNLHFWACWTHPQEDMLTGVEYHDVIMGEVILAEVWPLLANNEVTLLIWAPEKATMFHESCLFFVFLLSIETNPKEVVRLFSLVYNLKFCHGIVHIASMGHLAVICNVQWDTSQASKRDPWSP